MFTSAAICKHFVYKSWTFTYTDSVTVKSLVQHYRDFGSSANGEKEKRIVSARIYSSSNEKLQGLAEQFGTKKSSLAAELLEAAINEAWEEANRNS